MNFSIKPNALVPLLMRKPNCISFPRHFREELGILVGQFVQLTQPQSGEEVILEVVDALSGYQEVAFVSPENFKRIQGSCVKFKLLEITLGCDPEFFILWGSRRISASAYLPYVGMIGCDGALGELRPMYGLHEDKVTANLQELILRTPRCLKLNSWSRNLPPDGLRFSYQAHSYLNGAPAGFHVHLGIPLEILRTRADLQRTAMNHLVQCLDWYVAVPLVPLETNHQRRLGATRYGLPGDYRPKHSTLEYRTPGGFYLRTPKLARGLLGLALMVTEVTVSRMKEASKNFATISRLSKADMQEVLRIPEASVIQGVLLNRDIEVARRQLPGIYQVLHGLPNFEKHQRSVDDFFRAVDGREQCGASLLHNWKE